MRLFLTRKGIGRQRPGGNFRAEQRSVEVPETITDRVVGSFSQLGRSPSKDRNEFPVRPARRSWEADRVCNISTDRPHRAPIVKRGHDMTNKLDAIARQKSTFVANFEKLEGQGPKLTVLLTNFCGGPQI